jgi:hypothetical protein
MNYTQWPIKNATGRKRPTQTTVIPWRWLGDFESDLQVIVRYKAENQSHAVMMAVAELADRLRKKNNE